MEEYKALVAKMHEDTIVKEPKPIAKKVVVKETVQCNYNLLCGVGILLALLYIMPLLNFINSLTINQSNYMFVSDYIITVKICESELYMMYSDKDTTWQKQHFKMFHNIVHNCSYSMNQE